MKVYTAEKHWDYEGFEILGIFISEREAKKCCDNNLSKSKSADGYEISCFELGLMQRDSIKPATGMMIEDLSLEELKSLRDRYKRLNA